MAAKKRKTPKPAAKRVPLSLRVTPAMKDKLDVAADGSGRSLTQEIELRLERSFERQNILRDVLELSYGPHLAGFVQAISDATFRTVAGSHALLLIQKNADPKTVTPFGRALVDPWIFDQVARCTMAIIEHLRPPGSVDPPDEFSGIPFVKRVGEKSAEDLIDIMQGLRAQISEGVPPSDDDDRIQWAVESLADLLRLKEERMGVPKRSTQKVPNLEDWKAAEK